MSRFITSDDDSVINCDIQKNERVHVLLHLDRPLPFKDNSVDFILLEGVIAHLKHPLKLRRELGRILKPYGVLEILSSSCKATHRNNVDGVRQKTDEEGFMWWY